MKRRLKILQISPTYFAKESVLGGGERYVVELSKSMSQDADVELITFGPVKKTYMEGALKVKVLKPMFYVKKNIANPFFFNFYHEFKNADIIHVHQIHTILTEICILWARLIGKPIFLTDHGGGGRTFLTQLGITHLATALLAVSEYSAKSLESLHKKRHIIHGGVDLNTYSPITNVQKEKRKIISIGRILPHKGFHHLIEAIEDEHLVIIGQQKDLPYYRYLIKISVHKNITFIHDADNEKIKNELASSSLAVFPSTNTGIHGEKLPGEPELLGIAPLEAMAMNIPTIVSDVGAYPEICFDKKNYMFKHGNVSDLKNKIHSFWTNYSTNTINFKEHVESNYTWDKASRNCIKLYEELGKI